jgi:hypothetical protein
VLKNDEQTAKPPPSRSAICKSSALPSLLLVCSGQMQLH